MAVRQTLATALLMAAVAGCAELSAERPLFPAADSGPPPIAEGVWIAISEECPARNIARRRFPQACAPMEIRRQDDGAWRVSFRLDLVRDMSARERESEADDPNNGPYRMVLAPAVERAIASDSYAPLYVAEITPAERQTQSVGYAVLAPIGPMPTSEMRAIVSIGCASILRDGPIEGITPRYETRTDADAVEHQDLTGCVASTQAAVREAVRRAVIENLDELSERRFVLVRAD